MRSRRIRVEERNEAEEISKQEARAVKRAEERLLEAARHTRILRGRPARTRAR
jgi:hypothetical protein